MAPVKKRSSEADNDKKKYLMRQLRERIKNDPALYEETKRKERERYHARKQAGKIKTVDKMTNREQRKIRKAWRERSKRCFDSKKRAVVVENILKANTPPNSPENLNLNVENLETTSKIDSGKKKRRKNTRMLNEKIKKLEERLKIANKKAAKYKKRAQRLESFKTDTPTKNVKELVKNQKVSPQVKKQLLFGQVLIKQLRENLKDKKKYRQVVTGVAGKIIKKYKMSSKLGSLLSSKALRLQNKVETCQFIKKRCESTKKHILEFLEKDENSRLCPGKKDTVTRNRDKRQKRYLNNSLLNLHKDFCLDLPQLKISYATFCKFRPFWIVFPKVTDRDTCKCVIHENMSLIVNKLFNKKVIGQNSSYKLCKDLCCEGNHLKEKCLQRQYSVCENKKIAMLSGCEENDTITYQQWISKKVFITVKGVEKTCKKSVKEEFTTTNKKLFDTLQKSFLKFMDHVSKIKHQSATIKNIKKTLKSDEVLIHSDFSENYNCKYESEIQSAYFGGSKAQLSLHTVIVYYRCKESLEVLSKSFCTVSEDLRHDSAAVCAHLEPISKQVKDMVPTLNTVHLLSDSVVNQYRNKTMFHLIGTQLTRLFKVNELRWHYSESGHGKGAPDGIGGCLKRNADNLVAQGRDISSFEKFLFELGNQCRGVKIIPVEKKGIDSFKISKSLETFKGTFQIHEVVWSMKESSVLQTRRLSCLKCKAATPCNHYGIGKIHLTDTKNQDKVLPEKILDYSKEQQGPSDNNQKRARKCPPRQSRKLQYSDVYSDDSDVEEEYQKVNVNDFVITKIISAKKTTHHYVGMVVKKFNDEFMISFLKKSTTNLFVFPEKEDISHVALSEILTILNPPNVNQRGQYHFDDLKNYNISA